MDLATDLEKQSVGMFIQALLSKVKLSFITISQYPLAVDWARGVCENSIDIMRSGGSLGMFSGVRKLR